MVSGRPQRTLPKCDIHIELDEMAFRAVSSLAIKAESPCTKSRLIETLVFWMREDYMHDVHGDFIARLCRIRLDTLLLESTSGNKPQRRKLHVTLDIEAKRFCELIVAKNRECFPNISEVVNTFVHHLVSIVEEQHGSWARRCLADILAKYPPRY